jgi:hypothetical protein
MIVKTVPQGYVIGPPFGRKLHYEGNVEAGITYYLSLPHLPLGRKLAERRNVSRRVRRRKELHIQYDNRIRVVV